MRKKERFVLGKRTFRSQKSKHFVLRIINGVTNEVRIGDYDEGVLMLMYDDVVITKEVDLLRDYHD